MPLVQTAAIPSSAFGRSASQIETKSAHHTFSASCSAQPGRGSESAWGLSAVATTSPSGRASTPLELEVPMSTPRSSSPTLGVPEPVVVHVEKFADRAQLLDVVAGDGVDVIGAVSGEYLLRARVHPREGVGPHVGRLAHEVLVGLVVVAHEGAAHDVHPVTALPARQAGEGEVALGRQVVHRGAARWEEEPLRVEVDVTHVLRRVVAPGGEPGGVLARVAEVPDVAVRVVVAHVGEEDGGAREVLEDL